jgi:hypothetical protein
MRYFGRRGSVHLSDKRRTISVEKSPNPRKSLHERVCKVWMRSFAYDHQQGNFMLNDCFPFVGLVPNTAVMG